MKVQYTIDCDADVSVLGDDDKALLDFKMGAKKKRIPYWKTGTIRETPMAAELVLHGVGIPADEECRKALNLTDEQIARLQHHYARLNGGITPEDIDAYEAGAMTGYDKDGNWIKGPAYEKWMQAVTPPQSDI